ERDMSRNAARPLLNGGLAPPETLSPGERAGARVFHRGAQATAGRCEVERKTSTTSASLTSGATQFLMLGPRARFGIVRSSRSAHSSLRVLLDGAIWLEQNACS